MTDKDASFKIRGVIEGFYGKPWSHQQRIKGLKLFAKFNLNTYILAPKDDPWQRFDWRTPFTATFLDKTKELIDLAKSLKIDLNVCVSPGLTISYSSNEDLEALLVRFRQLSHIGVERFGLLLDDIPDELQFSVDKERFESIASAHASLANSLHYKIAAEFKKSSLFVCPLQYHGRGNEPYITELGQKLDSEIDLMWTGRQICSEYLDVYDAIKFKESTSKQPFYWDNFPVNDVAMIHQLHVGPIEKREANLGRYSVGLVANPMEHFESSLIPIATIADYLNNPLSYQPEQSWEKALIRIIPSEKDRSAIRHLFRNCFESCLAVNPAPEFNSVLGAATLSWRTGSADKAADLLAQFAKEIAENYRVIKDKDFSWPEVVEEIEPWLNKYHATGVALSRISQILLDCTYRSGRLVGSAAQIEEVMYIKNSLRQDPTRIFGDGLDMALGELATELAVAD